MSKNIARLMYGMGPDMRYATGLAPSDPFWWYQDTAGKTHTILNALEIEHGRHEATVDYVHEQGEVINEIRKTTDKISAEAIVNWFVSQAKKAPDVIEVPTDFPTGLYVKLTESGLKLKPAADPFFAGRAVKTKAEIELERTAQQANEHGFVRLRQILAEAEIGKKDALFWQDNPLTSEVLHGEVNAVLARAGCLGFNGGPIITGGNQTADPHERGSGQLYAHQFILMDSFPLHKNGYNGDLTRTYVKGTASQWHQDIYNAVLAAQEKALAMIQPGVNGKDIHAAVAKVLKDAGFATGQTKAGQYYGFFHGTGHGVGLTLHDFPQGTISTRDCVLEVGHITSVEPGLYYPKGTHKGGFGGCRIEDVVAVTKKGHDNLTTVAKDNWVVG